MYVMLQGCVIGVFILFYSLLFMGNSPEMYFILFSTLQLSKTHLIYKIYVDLRVIKLIRFFYYIISFLILFQPHKT